MKFDKDLKEKEILIEADEYYYINVATTLKDITGIEKEFAPESLDLEMIASINLGLIGLEMEGFPFGGLIEFDKDGTIFAFGENLTKVAIPLEKVDMKYITITKKLI